MGKSPTFNVDLLYAVARENMLLLRLWLLFAGIVESDLFEIFIGNRGD